jgi:hypothetical protein
VGLDSLLARDRSCDPGGDLLAREASEGAAEVLNCAVGLAFLGGVCGAGMAPAIARERDLRRTDGEEALIEKCIPQNIGRS